MGAVALFALFHGHAHGEEMSVIISPLAYALGFVISTAFLHISGVLTAHYALKTEISSKLLRATGAAMSVAGVLFLFGVI